MRWKKQLTKTKEQQQPTHANPMNPQQKKIHQKTKKTILWIGWRENAQEAPDSWSKAMGFQFSDCPCHQSDEKKTANKN